MDRIAEELVWRRRELTDMRALVQESSGQLRCRVAIRAGIALLYAHWEGFVKATAAHYLEYVASHRVPYRKLAPNFVALTLRSKFVEMKASEKVSSANALADFFCTSLDVQSRVPYKNVIDTKSNLSSKVLLDILTALGLDLGQFETRLNFIDTNLVNPRNHIAHGEALELTINEYLTLHDDVLCLIETFRNEIENSAVLRRFERSAA
ncbi:MAE_28990/MAE_18760 family HEPN-like nuclease [Paraburkholderia phenazinium]|uniref:MAE_28990/MAE_18760 family HEPN-like nuclease n=1 Tax=Paraburkholderia phenazinium TaxID=60549 RepID=UPI00158DC7E2|nr:MAE_28990/MAE_18760 family HEPN-like nuclease [Paraburkholderia phenazinium]